MIHYYDVTMSAMASQIAGVSSVCSTVGSDADQRKHQSSASLAFVRGIHRWPGNSPPKKTVARKMFPFDDVIIPKYRLLLLRRLIARPSHHCPTKVAPGQYTVMTFSIAISLWVAPQRWISLRDMAEYICMHTKAILHFMVKFWQTAVHL